MKTHAFDLLAVINVSEAIDQYWKEITLIRENILVVFANSLSKWA